jgi:hypothetical protein
MQTTSHLLMIRPIGFGYNAETAVNNAFQVKSAETGIQQKALKEFNDFVNLLVSNGDRRYRSRRYRIAAHA